MHKKNCFDYDPWEQTLPGLASVTVTARFQSEIVAEINLNNICKLHFWSLPLVSEERPIIIQAAIIAANVRLMRLWPLPADDRFHGLLNLLKCTETTSKLATLPAWLIHLPETLRSPPPFVLVWGRG